MRVRRTTLFLGALATLATLIAGTTHEQVSNCPFNVDGNVAVTDALRDGVILGRYARGERNVNALVAGTGVTPSSAIITTIQSNIDRLDINGNGSFDEADATAILRVLFKFNTDAASVIPAVQFASRTTQPAIKAYLDGGCVSTTLPDLQRTSKFLQQTTFGPTMAEINAFNALTEDSAVAGNAHKRKVST